MIIDKTNFHNIIVNLISIENDKNYNELIEKLEELHEIKSEITIHVETILVKNISMKYLYRFGKYLNEIRKKSPMIEYIEIKVYDNVVFTILNTLFTYVSKPITKTTIVFYNGGYDENIKNRNIIKTKIFNVK